MTLDELTQEITRAGELPPIAGARRLRELIDLAKGALSAAADDRVYLATRSATQTDVAEMLGVTEGVVRKALRRRSGRPAIVWNGAVYDEPYDRSGQQAHGPA